MNQQLFSIIKIATMKITDDFCYKCHVPTTKSTLFTVSKDEWDTKEGTGKSMKNALCAAVWQKISLRQLVSQ